MTNFLNEVYPRLLTFENMKATKVSLRKKALKKGRESLYLDFYPPVTHPGTGKKTRREFLGLYVYAKTSSPLEAQHNKQTKALAESIRARRQIEIQNNIYGFSSEAKRQADFIAYFRELADKRFTSHGNYGNWMSAYKHLAECFVDGLTVGEITTERIQHFKEYLNESTDLSQNSKATYFGKFKAAIKQAFKDGLLAEDVGKRVPAIKQAETKREFVTVEELETLAKTECGLPVLKHAFIFSALTGLRLSDVRALTWGNVQENRESGHFIRFMQKKTKGRETLPIPAPALKVMGERGDKDAPVFPGLPDKVGGWQATKLREWFLRAGIDRHITFHCARHSFATIQLTLGTDIYTVSKLLGHKELKTTQIYAKVVDQRKKDAVDRMNDIDI